MRESPVCEKLHVFVRVLELESTVIIVKLGVIDSWVQSQAAGKWSDGFSARPDIRRRTERLCRDVCKLQSADNDLGNQRMRVPVRSGFTVVETVCTCLLLSILFTMTIPALLMVARERKSTEQRQFALQHVANLLEEVATREWSELKLGEAAIPEAEPDLMSILPELKRTMVITESDTKPVCRQITATIRWQNQAGQHVAPIRLSTWIYPPKEVP